jgi:hypothetical protein
MIITASLSVLLSASFTALALENRYQPFLDNSPKRVFPSPNEMDIFRHIYSDFYAIKHYYNIATSPDEYDIHRGLTGKLEAFTGVPRQKLFEGRPIMEASTTESFYDLLYKTNTRYIVLPKEVNFTDGNSNNERATTVMTEQIKEPGKFALQSFARTFENEDYIVLIVPPLPSVHESGEQEERNSRPERDEFSLHDIVKLPGELSEEAVRSGVDVPWQNIMASPNSIALLTSVISITLVGSLIVTKKLHWKQSLQLPRHRWW